MDGARLSSASMKDFLKSAVCDALAFAIIIATIQGCRYANIKIDQLEVKSELKKP